MDFFIEILIITVGFGGVGYFFMELGKKNESLILLGIIGAFSCIGAVGGLALLGLMSAAYVWNEVSKVTFGLLGVICAAPFVLIPAYVIFKILFSSEKRDYDGRYFDDGDG